MKVDIQPFREFWLDCNSTILFSIYSALNKDRLRMYNNNYTYNIVNAGTGCAHDFNTIVLNLSMNSFQNLFLKKHSEYVVKNRSDLKYIKDVLLKDNLIVLLGVDLYYWIEDSLHWKKNHIQHFSLVKGYSEEEREFIVLETGSKGYNQYNISQKKFLKAAVKSGAASVVYQIVDRIEKPLSLDVILEQNVREIVNSIMYIENKIDTIWVVADYNKRDMTYFADFILTHIYAIENRQKANSILMRHMFDMYNKKLFQECSCRFGELNNKYYFLKMQLMADAKNGRLNTTIDMHKKYLLKYLIIEKEIWNDVSKR